MKCMATWTIPTGNYTEALDRFLESGAPAPEGMTILGRWHAPGSRQGWVLSESDDPVAVATHMSQWAHLLELEVTPVLDDEQAGAAAMKARGG